MGNQQSSALSGDIQEKKSLIVQLSKQTIAGLDHVPLLSTAASLCMGGARARDCHKVWLDANNKDDDCAAIFSTRDETTDPEKQHCATADVQPKQQQLPSAVKMRPSPPRPTSSRSRTSSPHLAPSLVQMGAWEAADSVDEEDLGWQFALPPSAAAGQQQQRKGVWIGRDVCSTISKKFGDRMEGDSSRSAMLRAEIRRVVRRLRIEGAAGRSSVSRQGGSKLKGYTILTRKLNRPRVKLASDAGPKNGRGHVCASKAKRSADRDTPAPPCAHVCVELGYRGRRWRLRCARWASWSSFVALAAEATGIQDLGSCRIILSAGGGTRDGAGQEASDASWRKFAMEGGGGALVVPSTAGSLYEGYLQLGEERRPVHWKLGKLLGRGAYGSVHTALLETGKTIAIKRLEGRGHGKGAEQAVAAFRNEAELLERLAHPNVAKFWACEVTKERAMMWMEFLSGGSVAHMIQSFGPLREDTASKFTGHALSGLCYLHEHGVIHRDVKPSNLLVSSSGTVKLGDFGAAASLPEGNGDAKMTGIAGTAQYMAPEMLRMNRGGSENEGVYGANADVWSLGVTVGEMLTGYVPYDDLSNPFAVMFRIAKEPSYTLSSISKSLEGSSPHARCFVEQCLERRPSTRPSSAQMAKHAFLVDL